MAGFHGTTAGMGAYLQSSLADAMYLKKADAAATYLGSSIASSLLTKSTAAGSYLSSTLLSTLATKGTLETTGAVKTYDINASGVLAAVGDAVLQAASGATSKLVLLGSTQDVTATGTVQADAAAATATRVFISGGGADAGVKLLTASAGLVQMIYNGTGTQKRVWANSSDALMGSSSGGAADGYHTLAASKAMLCWARDAATWFFWVSA